MEAHGEKLSRKQELAIAALLTCSAIADAAKQCSIGEVTLHRWLKDATFQAAYREARRQVMQAAEAPASAKVSAAKTILETAVKAVELEDLEARIVALEAAQQG